MKKKIFITIFIFLLIFGLIIFSFKSCNPRTKTLDNPEEEFEAFVNANIEFTCLLAKNPLLMENNVESQTILNKTYKKFKLPVEDNEKLINILEKYSENTEAISIIKTNTQNCQLGGSPIFYQTK